MPSRDAVRGVQIATKNVRPLPGLRVLLSHALHRGDPPGRFLQDRHQRLRHGYPQLLRPGRLPEPDEKDDYFLYVGRLIGRKGYRIAQDVCDRLHKRLIVCGFGDFDGYGEYRGVVGIEEREKLMSRAQAVFVPTQYLEPFGGVHAEALLCGSPVITSDFGVFTETVTPEVGRRCRSLRDYLQAVEEVQTLDREFIREYALSKFSYEAIRPQYERYFEKLLTVRDEGWYET